MKKIAVIGSNMVDLITYTDRMPKGGETLAAPAFKMGCGGKGANQAVAAAKLGADILMVSKVGDDMFADNTIRNFQSYGINTKYVSKMPQVSSGVAPIFVHSSSQNAILVIKGANEYLTPYDIDKAKDAIMECGLIVLQLEVPLETVYYAIDLGNKYNIPVLLNPAPAVADLDIEYACRCDFFMPNETELETLVGEPVQTIEQIKNAANILLNKGLKNVIVTMGSKGALWLSQHGDEAFIESVKVNAIDASGAGDAFIGCFSHYFLQTNDVLTSLRKATLFAALSVTEKGTQFSYPSIEQFKAFEQKNNKKH